MHKLMHISDSMLLMYAIIP